MNKYDLVVFDLDGTLLDTSIGVLTSVEKTIEHFGFEKLTEEKKLSFIGPPFPNRVREIYGLNDEETKAATEYFRDRYKNIDLLKAAPYEGIYDLMTALKERGIESSVATYKREEYALKLLHHYEFQKYCPVMHGSDMEDKLKKEDIIELCMKESGHTDRSRVLMVGDTLYDAKGAHEIGVDFIGVSYGFGLHTEEEQKEAEAVAIVSRTVDILNYV